MDVDGKRPVSKSARLQLGATPSDAFRKRFDPLKDDYHYPISLIYSRKRQLTNAEKNFVKFIQDYKQ